MGAKHGPRVHVHEADPVPDLPDDLIRGFAEEWGRLDEGLKQINDTKSAMLQKVRAVHGRFAADALKETMRLIKEGHEKRAKKAAISNMARRFLRVIEGDPFFSRFHH